MTKNGLLNLICTTYDKQPNEVQEMADKFIKIMAVNQLVALCLVGQLLAYGDIESYLNQFRVDSIMVMDYKYQLLQAFR